MTESPYTKGHKALQYYFIEKLYFYQYKIKKHIDTIILIKDSVI